MAIEERIVNMRNLCMALVAGAVLMGAASCGRQEQKKVSITHADSVLFAAGRALDYQQLLTLTDSFEQAGAITRMNANRWRGVAYNHLGQVRNSEFYYRKVVDAPIETEQDLYYYNKSARRLAELLMKRGEFEEALRVATPALERLNASEGDEKDYAILLNTVGCCQLNLGQLKEAAANYDEVSRRIMKLAVGDSTMRNLDDAILVVDDITMSYINTKHFDKALHWTEVFDSLMQIRASGGPENRDYLKEQYLGRADLCRMLTFQGLGMKREAAAVYRKLAGTKFGNSDEGLIGLASYLMAAGRYSEAADNFTHLDNVVRKRGMELTLDNISVYLLPKFKANVEAGRRDSALAVGLRLCDVLDSALIWAKRSDAAELATIYDTQQKENTIAWQRADMSRQRMISTIVVSILVFVFLAIYIYHRIKAQRRLAAAFHQLEIANTKLEDTNTKLEHANTKLEDTNTKLEHANTKLELANTELEQKNEQLTVANERAEESSRMKTNFIQQISHEIRTPLNILSGFTQVLTTPGIELEEAEWTNINRQITENTNRITGLVNKMLELSDVNSRAVIEKNDYVLAIQIAAQAAEDSHITTASHLNFDMQIGEGADSAMLQTNLATATRALTLVLDNARKFTKGAEALHHQETEPAEKKSAVLRIETAGDKVQFIVEDTGIGVPPEEAEHIFDEFVQLNEYYDGTGIGLTVARSLARRLGGDIKMDASYTAGARFILTL